MMAFGLGLETLGLRLHSVLVHVGHAVLLSVDEVFL
jgi:hypothetical protein